MYTATFARSSILTLLLMDSAKLLALPIASLSWLESLCSDWRLGLQKQGIIVNITRKIFLLAIFVVIINNNCTTMMEMLSMIILYQYPNVGCMQALRDSWYYGTSILIIMIVSGLGVNVLYLMRCVI